MYGELLRVENTFVFFRGCFMFIGERERANLVVRSSGIFYIYIYIMPPSSYVV